MGDVIVRLYQVFVRGIAQLLEEQFSNARRVFTSAPNPK